MTNDMTAKAPRRRRSRTEMIVRFIGVLGRVFVAAGVLLLFFTGYLLWGTGVYTKHEQNKAREEIQRKQPVVDQAAIDRGEKIPSARPATPPKPGDPLFSIQIPKIGLDTVIVHGVGREELKKGPGLFPKCEGDGGDCVSDAKFPGESGNVAVSGHRTTYGAPFFRLNELQQGDTIDFISRGARYRYKVREQKIVDPVAGFEVVEQHGRDEVTLTTCHPRFSAAQRLIVHADYEGASLVRTPAAGRGPDATAPADTPVIPTDVLILASIAAGSALGSLALSKRYRVAAAYIALTIVGASGLWIAAFPRIVGLLPENY